MSKIDEKYHKLLQYIIDNGYKYEDPNRKGIFRHQISDYKIVHNFKDGFPALTTKKLAWKSVVGELIWILRGDTNIKYLVDNGINIWNKDAYNYYMKTSGIKNTPDEKKWTYDFYVSQIKNIGSGKHCLGDIGRGYGAQLRDWMKSSHTQIHWVGIDQLKDLIHTLKTNPMATKKTVTFWNPAEKDQCALTPCHWSFEILVEPLSLKQRIDIHDKLYIPHNRAECDNFRLNLVNGSRIPKYQFTLKWHQHSVDTFLGLPFNIASYALLAHIIGKMTNMVPKGIIGDLSNVHIYEPHLDAVKEQLSRDVNKYGECKLQLGNLETYCEVLYNTSKDIGLAASIDSILNLVMTDLNDVKLKGYTSYPRIPAEMLAYNK